LNKLVALSDDPELKLCSTICENLFIESILCGQDQFVGIIGAYIGDFITSHHTWSQNASIGCTILAVILELFNAANTHIHKTTNHISSINNLPTDDNHVLTVFSASDHNDQFIQKLNTHQE
jgi:hypothetical protein